MKEFLRLVAEHYAGEVKAASDSPLLATRLSDYLFVFPNRRAGLFFKQYLSENFFDPIMAPRTIVTGELYGMLSELKIADRLSLLFRLYSIYNRLAPQYEESFDSFVFWGDMLLSDFNEVDQYCVDARQLFANIKDLKEIEENFSSFSDEVKEVVEAFWRTIYKNPEEGTSGELGDTQKKFVDTWSILCNLYSEFKESLKSDGEAYEGMLQREVVEDIKCLSKDELCCLLPYKKIVFVGLNAISRVDRMMMKHLKDLSIAEFCWDYADPRTLEGVELTVLGRKHKNSISRAAYFTQENLSDFSNALSADALKKSIVDLEEKNFRVIAVPSSVGQASEVRRVLKEWCGEGKEDAFIHPDSSSRSDIFNPIRTAVVLPDEKLLVPMLYAIPDELSKFNVTMGYSLNQTPAASFVNALIRLQLEARRDVDDQIVTFHYRSVQSLLAHSFIKTLCGDLALQLNSKIVEQKLYRIKAVAKNVDEISVLSILEENYTATDKQKDCFRLLFKQIDAHPQSLLDYLKAMLQVMLEMLMPEENEEIESDEEIFEENPGISRAINYESIDTYLKTLEKMEELMLKYRSGEKIIEFSTKTFAILLHRLTFGIKVPFAGEPLNGLQVMGVLETRALDFDNLIIPSMNEDIFPAKTVTNTYIPMNLRKAYGMLTHEHRDAVWAYHFYRLLGRAKNVVFLYDSRMGGLMKGEKSRYLLQLEHLYGCGDKLRLEDPFIQIASVETKPIEIAKTPEILERLNRYVCDNVSVKQTELLEIKSSDVETNVLSRAKGKKNLSASSLKCYLSCPLRFYFQYVLDLNEENEVSEEIDSGEVGTILHDSMQDLYERLRADIVHHRGAITDKTVFQTIKKEIEQTVEKHYKEVKKLPLLLDLEGYHRLVCDVIKNYVKTIVDHDQKLLPFTYIDSEANCLFAYPASKRTLRIKAIFDRIDLVHNNLRVVDYKTGNSGKGAKLKYKSLKDFFATISDPSTTNKGSQEAFQVLMYCLLIDSMNIKGKNQLLGKALNSETGKFYQDLSPHLYFVRDMHSRKGDASESANASSQLVCDGTHVNNVRGNILRDFKAMFDSLLESIFDANQPFRQSSDEKECIFCPFTTLCQRNPKRDGMW